MKPVFPVHQPLYVLFLCSNWYMKCLKRLLDNLPCLSLALGRFQLTRRLIKQTCHLTKRSYESIKKTSTAILLEKHMCVLIVIQYSSIGAGSLLPAATQSPLPTFKPLGCCLFCANKVQGAASSVRFMPSSLPCFYVFPFSFSSLDHSSRGRILKTIQLRFRQMRMFWNA